MSDVERSKEAAGRAAAAEVADGMVLGLGTGSTVAPFLEAVAARIRGEGLSLRGVPTSEETAVRARQLGIPLTDLDTDPVLDLAVDGADEVDPALRLVKGGGGALLREKIVASAARRVVIVVGQGKRVEVLGKDFLLPVEILPFGATVTMRKVSALGCQPFLRTRGEEPAARPFATDNGNWILDCRFPEGIADPEDLHARLLAIPGVLEAGLFLGLCQTLIEGRPDGTVEVIQRDEA